MIWGTFGDDLGSWEGPGGVLGGSLEGLGQPWGRHWRPRSSSDRFVIDFQLFLKPVLGPKTDQNRSKVDARIN